MQSAPASAQVASASFLSPENLDRIAQLDFDSFNTKDGLPHQSVYSFTQDSAGFVWIATYGGLSRFDGYQMRSYIHDPARPNSLPDNNVRVLLPGPDGDLWIGSDAGGVFYYRASTDSFEELPNAPAGLKGLRTYCLISDGHGGIWAGGQFGLFHFDPRSRSYEIFSTSAESLVKSSFVLRNIFSIFLDSHGTLWVGGDPGLFQRKAGASNFEPVLGLEGKDEVGLRPFVWSFLEDHAGRLWVGCDHVGIATYDPAENLLRGVRGMSGPLSEIGEHTVRGLIERSPGRIWIATYGAGLLTYDVSTGFIRSFVKGSNSPAPLPNNFLRGIFRDRSGVIWIGTDNGLARLTDTSAGVFHLHPTLDHPARLSGTDTRSFGIVDGQVWIGFDQGEFGPLNENALVRKIDPAPGVTADLVTRREIVSIKKVDASTVYVGGSGLFRVDLKTHTYRPSADPLIMHEVVSSLCPDSGHLWAGSYNGLYDLDLTTGQSQMFRHNPADPDSLSENDIRDLLLARDGRLWIATRTGLDVLDPARRRFRSFRHIAGDTTSLAGDNVRAMTEDRLGRIWIATAGNGLSVLDRWTFDKQPVFRTLDTNSGLLSNDILTVATGKDGRVWANTAGGLSVVNPRTFAVQTYTAGDGLRSTAQKLFGSVTLDDGTLLFRSVDGLIAVQTDHLELRSYRAPLVMTSLKFPGSTLSLSAAAWKAMHEPSSLSARHRSFLADFALLDYTDPGTTLYSYRLTGVDDDDWSPLAPGVHSISYNDLPPGTFKLRVRAISRSGQGPVVEASYDIRAPRVWTETLPFRIFLGLLALALPYVLIRLRTRVFERRRQHLEQEIQLRTMELDDQRRRLEEANLLLGQLAIRDSLTNLYNRRHFLELADAEWMRSRRSRRTFSLLLLDIDHFKRVNDTYGHLTGDAVIQMVADRITGSLRSTDSAARFGGEEFIVLLPETSGPAAVQLAERICDAVAFAPLRTADKDIRTTLSVGCAEFDRNASLTQLLERADKALYLAKAAGRNRIKTA